ncbi:hypothetical protein WA026_006647 [Henosepilachna vigintioctopunctata]|uniref:Uncharacterized protein n=1 Tax=Henosepilachna vigintioctopunctata TaxID=420089 RepID=A0AAW1U7C7_9CUCU
MDILLFAVFAFLLVIINAEMTKEQIKEISDSILQECKTETKAKDDDILIFNQSKLPTSREGLCMVECFLDKVGMMSDGKYNKEGIVAALQTVIKDDNEVKKLKTVAEVCYEKIGVGVADRCENAKSTLTCLVVDGQKHGFDLLKYSLG